MSSQTRLFVGGIPGGTTADALGESFAQFGRVIGCDLKSKPSDPDSHFAFVTLSAGLQEVETCIRHFCQEEWRGCRLHVTRARESFLERLQKERAQAQAKKPTELPVLREPDNVDGKFKIKTPETTNLNIKKPGDVRSNSYQNEKMHDKWANKTDAIPKKFDKYPRQNENPIPKKFDKYPCQSENFNKGNEGVHEKFNDDKKLNSDNKRLESMRKMRKDFNEKKLLIKSGLAGVDKVCNKRIKFDDDDRTELVEDTFPESYDRRNGHAGSGKTLFDDDDDEDQKEVNFQIKEQFEGKRGQKTLELQSRFKSDKRFNLDERFAEEGDAEEGGEEEVQVSGEGERARQLNILQNVLGVAVRSSHTQPAAIGDSKKRTKMGMLRFDPNHPDHAKFLAPTDNSKKEVDNSSKKKKAKRKEDTTVEPENAVDKVEVSKEQFYSVSDTLKEAIAQPNTFSLRSLFNTDQTQDDDDDNKAQDTGYTPLPAIKKDKVKNPFDSSSKNPFKYDSSDSEPEAEETEAPASTQETALDDNKAKAVWREKLFFTRFDNRFKEGLAFFNNTQGSGNKERRELKFLVKKRLYNRSRKDHMFQKKIGGKRKTFNNKNRKQKR